MQSLQLAIVVLYSRAMKKKLEITHDAGDGVTVVRTGRRRSYPGLVDARSDDAPERCKHLRPARRKRVLGDPESLSGLLALFPSSAPSADVQKFLPRKPVVGVVGKTTSREVVAGPVFSLAEAFNSSAALDELLKKQVKPPITFVESELNDEGFDQNFE